MKNFFNSEASNYLVSVAVKVSKVENKTLDEFDSKSLLELYNSVNEGVKIIEATMEKIEKSKGKKVT